MRILIYFKENALAVKAIADNYSILGEVAEFKKPLPESVDQPWGQVPQAISQWCNQCKIPLNDDLTVMVLQEQLAQFQLLNWMSKTYVVAQQEFSSALSLPEWAQFRGVSGRDQTASEGVLWFNNVLQSLHTDAQAQNPSVLLKNFEHQSQQLQMALKEIQQIQAAQKNIPAQVDKILKDNTDVMTQDLRKNFKDISNSTINQQMKGIIKGLNWLPKIVYPVALALLVVVGLGSFSFGKNSSDSAGLRMRDQILECMQNSGVVQVVLVLPENQSIEFAEPIYACNRTAVRQKSAQMLHSLGKPFVSDESRRTLPILRPNAIEGYQLKEMLARPPQ